MRLDTSRERDRESTSISSSVELSNATHQDCLILICLSSNYMLNGEKTHSAIRLTGPFVTMIYSMITGDMFTFSIIYVIFLFGFSQAYFFLYKGHENPDETPYGTYMSTWMGLLQMTLGDYDVSSLLTFSPTHTHDFSII